MSFVQATALRESGDTLTAEISRDWEIWGPNGGYLSAIALRAAGLRAPAGHRPASISVQYLSRAEFGAAEFSVALRREARTAACFAVSMRQNDKAILDAQIWTTNKPESEGPDYAEITMSDVPAPETLPLFQNTHFPFWDNFQSHAVRETPLGDPDPRGARTEHWVKYKDFPPTDDPFLAQARALLLIDTLPFPAHWRRQAVQLDYVAPSLDVSVWFHESSCDADWLLIEAQAPKAGAGLIYGSARAWTRDGKLVASGGSNMLHTATRPRA